jgi:hypothetical protein
MSRSIPTIQGVPFKKVASTEEDKFAVIETLSCGHTIGYARRDWHPATKRRCYHCKVKEPLPVNPVLNPHTYNP